MAQALLKISLFGPCIVQSIQDGRYAITGAKHRAIFALLATAPLGRRTRNFLQTTLWGTHCFDTGRQSLRRALSDIKHLLGDDFAELIDTTHADITLDLRKVRFDGRAGDGLFLDGIDIREKGFVSWVDGIRTNPDQLGALSGSALTARAPVQPVVAVLPFSALGGDPIDVTLGDWFAEQICRSLSRSRLLAVISHLSGRELVRQTIDIAAVRTKLRADFCVMGSLRREGARVVLDADLIDTASSQILWTEEYCLPADNFTERAGEVIQTILSHVASSIAEDAVRHARQSDPTRIDSHRLLIAGVTLMHRRTLHEFALARSLLEEALRRAPYSAESHAWLGKWYVLSVFNGYSTDAAQETSLAIDSTARALDLEPDDAFCLTIDGFAQNNLRKRLDIATARYDLAIEKSPSCSLAWLLRGALHAFRDEGEEAVHATERGRRLSPLDPFGYFYDTLTATAYLAASDYEQALDLADRSLAINDRHISTLRTKITALHYLGRGAEAVTAARELMQRAPNFTVEAYRRTHPAADYDFGRRVAVAFRAAGLP
jgi:TolB-like protein